MAGYAMNPVLETCAQDEDFVGRLARVCRAVSPRLTALRTIQRYQLQCREVWLSESRDPGARQPARSPPAKAKVDGQWEFGESRVLKCVLSRRLGFCKGLYRLAQILEILQALIVGYKPAVLMMVDPDVILACGPETCNIGLHQACISCWPTCVSRPHQVQPP